MFAYYARKYAATTQVSVAALLDNFIGASGTMEMEEKVRQKSDMNRQQNGCCLITRQQSQLDKKFFNHAIGDRMHATGLTPPPSDVCPLLLFHRIHLPSASGIVEAFS